MWRGEQTESVSHLFWVSKCELVYCVYQVLTSWTNRQTANRKGENTQATCAPTDTHKQDWRCLVCGLCVRWSWEGLTPRQRVWERRREIALCDTRLFIDTGEVEMDPNGSPLLHRAPPAVCECLCENACRHYCRDPLFYQQVSLRSSSLFHKRLENL